MAGRPEKELPAGCEVTEGRMGWGFGHRLPSALARENEYLD